MFWEKREQKIFFLYEKKNKKSEKGEKINEFNNGVVVVLVVGFGAGGVKREGQKDQWGCGGGAGGGVGGVGVCVCVHDHFVVQIRIIFREIPS